MDKPEPFSWFVFSKDGEYYLRRTWDYSAAVQLSIDGFVVKPA